MKNFVIQCAVSLRKKVVVGILPLAALAMSAAAQTTAVTTTNGGTTGTVPIFTSNSNVENSAIVQTNGNVGIGTASPGASLTVNGTAAFGGIGSPDSGSKVAISGNLELTSDSVDQGQAVIYTVSDWSDGGGYDGALVFAPKYYNNSYSYTERMRIMSNGNVGIGTTSPQALLDVNGNIRISGQGAGLVFPDGIQTEPYTGTCPSTGGDYAESVDVEGDKKSYEPGDVMVIDPDHPGHFLMSSEPYSTLVAGIYSTKPGYVGRRQTTNPKLSTTEIPMAMVGIVPTKATTENGPIKVGDLLVTSSKPGYVMKGTDHDKMTGTIVGKALASLKSDTGVIEVLVSLQ